MRLSVAHVSRRDRQGDFDIRRLGQGLGARCATGLTGAEVGWSGHPEAAWCEREERSRGVWGLPTPVFADDAIVGTGVDRIV